MAVEVASLTPMSRRDRLLRGGVDVLIALAIGAVVIAAVLLADPLMVGGALVAAAATFLLRKWIFTWTTMLFLLTAVILFVPIRRYALPIDVGPALEPYRVMIVALIVAIAVAVMTGRSLTWRPVVWGWSIAIFLWTMFASLMFNAVTLTEAGAVIGPLGNVVQLGFLLSTAVIVRQLLRSERVVMILLNFMVIGGAAIGCFAFIERYFGVNVFLQLQRFLPLVLLRDDAESLRAGGLRAYASAQHPIALSVVFCMLIPLAIYLMRHSPWPRVSLTRRLLYIACIGAMGVGLLSAVSRTGVVVLGVMFLVTLLLRPRVALVLAAIALPIVTLVGLVLPRLFESTVGSFLDIDALIASQFTSIGFAGQGRLADLPEAFADFRVNPWAGTGVGTRVVVGDAANAQILDNQWLGSLLEAGVIGMTKALAREFAPAIRINAVAPGPVETAMVSLEHMSEEWIAKELAIP
ncbi:SDR family oxidoreductase, partial [uncultured Demequina sp.]|uniref:SDR family oxidoreductase n=1 Tax=uncultured Demequina sp. TaxID=693499 RepID=UPI0025CC9DB6